MSREERIELMTSVVTKLDEAAMLLTQAEEVIFADRVDELPDLIETWQYLGRMPRRHRGRLQPPLPSTACRAGDRLARVYRKARWLGLRDPNSSRWLSSLSLSEDIRLVPWPLGFPEHLGQSPWVE